MIGMFWICVHLILFGILHDGDAVYNGMVAKVGQFKYMAIINGPQGRCGGVVLDNYHILTAAHCVDRSKEEDIEVVAGVVDLNMPLEVIYRLKKIYIHPHYRSQGNEYLDCFVQIFSYLFKSCRRIITLKMENDIAVLTLTEPLFFGGNIMSVNLPFYDSLPYRTPVNYAGWGASENKKDNKLRYIYLMIMPPGESEEWDMLCGENTFYAQSSTRNSWIDSGDSGSPLVEGNIVYGITSRGQSCLGGSIVFTKVFSHLEFIRNATSDICFF